MAVTYDAPHLFLRPDPRRRRRPKNDDRTTDWLN